MSIFLWPMPCVTSNSFPFYAFAINWMDIKQIDSSSERCLGTVTCSRTQIHAKLSSDYANEYANEAHLQQRRKSESLWHYMVITVHGIRSLVYIFYLISFGASQMNIKRASMKKGIWDPEPLSLLLKVHQYLQQLEWINSEDKLEFEICSITAMIRRWMYCLSQNALCSLSEGWEIWFWEQYSDWYLVWGLWVHFYTDSKLANTLASAQQDNTAMGISLLDYWKSCLVDHMHIQTYHNFALVKEHVDSTGDIAKCFTEKTYLSWVLAHSVRYWLWIIIYSMIT